MQEIVQNTKKLNESIQSVKTAEVNSEEKRFEIKSGRDSSQDWTDTNGLYVGIIVAILIVAAM